MCRSSPPPLAPPPFPLPPLPSPQRDDEDLFEYLTAVRHACIDAFTGFFLAFGLPSEEDETTGKAIATKDPRRLAQQANAARVLCPAAVPAFAEVARLWAHEWAKEQAEASKNEEEWEGPDFVLLQKTVAAIGDAAKVVGRASIAPFFTNRSRSCAPPTSTPFTNTMGRVGQPVHILSARRRRHWPR